MNELVRISRKAPYIQMKSREYISWHGNTYVIELSFIIKATEVRGIK